MGTLLVDSHCHLPLLTESKPPGTLEAILAQARENGVGHLLCVSIDLKTFPQILELASSHGNIFASLGVHPNSTCAVEPDVDELMRWAVDPHVVAIGETGLDYFRSQGDLEWQRERFRRHIRCARSCGKPLIIHMRDARVDVVRILMEENAHEVGGIMHCFVDDYDTAVQAMEMNFLISFSGIVTFRNATALQDVARRVPLDRMLVETDSPYLAPVPYRGRENQPAYVRHVAEFIAHLKGVATEQVIAVTTENFFRLFRGASRQMN